jgi:hypothetical protein
MGPKQMLELAGWDRLVLDDANAVDLIGGLAGGKEDAGQ